MTLTQKYYNDIIHKLEILPTIALVTTGRCGSDYFQSLLDGHSQVMTFNGHFACYSEFFTTSKTFSLGDVNDIVDEFIGTYIYKLNSRYDIQEQKDRLGTAGNEFININRETFKTHLVNLISTRPVTTKAFLLAVYGAYHLSLNRNPLNARVLVHHAHVDYEFQEFIKDFPDCRVLVTTRDPRANLVSLIENFRRYYPNTHDNMGHVFASFRMVCGDTDYIEDSKRPFYVIKLENLPKQEALKEIASWMKIDFELTMLTPTWGGLLWISDRLSPNPPSLEWSPNRSYNNWHKRLGWLDKLVLNAILNPMLKSFHYEHINVNPLIRICLPLLIIFPLKYERRFLSPVNLFRSFKSGDVKQKLNGLLFAYFYIKRIELFLSILAKNKSKAR